MLLQVVFVLILNGALSSASLDIFDLTWNFGNNTIYVPGQQSFEFTKQANVSGEKYTYAINDYCTAEHGGTHFDAPYHFYQKGWKVADVPVSRLFAKGALINLTKEHELLGRNTRLTVKHLEDWEARNGKFVDGSVLLVQFGRSRYWQNRTQYLDLDSDDVSMNFPGFSEEAARWIVNTGKFYGVGLDTPSIDPGNTTDYFAHTLLSEHSLYNIENVKLLGDLPERGFDLIIAPMKIDEGTGAPVRIFAKVERGA